jgi:hypothetical protein
MRTPVSEPTISYQGIGQYRKGTIKWDGEAWEVFFPYLTGVKSTQRMPERYSRWYLASGAYREHSREVVRSSPAPVL